MSRRRRGHGSTIVLAGEAGVGKSRHANPWAAHLYGQAIARGHRHPHAVRILARAWLGVIWRCWQDHDDYIQRDAQPQRVMSSGS